MKLLALFFTFILLTAPALAASVTIDIFGTNVSNAQSNITKTGNNSFQVVQWAVGDTTKSLKADINGNASDDITFTIHNLTVGRVVEVKVNSSSYNSYQADSTGSISFTRTQIVRNQTYSFSPSVNAGGYNFTWIQFWTYPSLFGLNFTNYFLPYSGATADLDMNGRNITNVRTFNVTTTNVTVLNATQVQGNGSGLSALNATNLTGAMPHLNDSSGNAMLFNTSIINSSTVTVTNNSNGTIQLTSTSSGGANIANATLTIISDFNNPSFLTDSNETTCASIPVPDNPVILEVINIDTGYGGLYQILGNASYNSQGGASNWVGFFNLSVSRDNITYTALRTFGGVVNSPNITYNVTSFINNSNKPTFTYFRYIKISKERPDESVGDAAFLVCEIAVT